jgi:hypothetical protein
MHILQGRFVKIMRYGKFNHTLKHRLSLQFKVEEKTDIDTQIKQREPKETNQEHFKRLTEVDSCQCLVCKKKRVIKVSELPRIRSPTWKSILNHLAPTF